MINYNIETNMEDEIKSRLERFNNDVKKWLLDNKYNIFEYKYLIDHAAKNGHLNVV